MGNRKCPHCGLVNFADANACRRCMAILFDQPPEPPPAGRSGPPLVIRLGVIGTVVATVLLGWWVSLLATSEPLDGDQRAIVDDAITLLDERGFTRQAFVLRHVTSFRSTDNWWNLYHEHYQAYAATNFPFEIVTLYPWFFELPQDDVERAVVLLHEAHHLLGADEATALRRVWQEKSRLGWTADVYARGKVWKNTREWTQYSAPDVFVCSEDADECDP